jgi:hypothetical protein
MEYAFLHSTLVSSRFSICVSAARWLPTKVIEAEVRYAVRHEYALTATDVISRRLRLSFLNAQAAFEALPRVIDIMAEDLNWNAARKRQEMAQTTRFLQSMGLPPGNDIPTPVRSSQRWFDWVYRLAGITATTTSSHGRAQFEAGEADSLREAFLERSRDSDGRLDKPTIRELLQDIPAYAGIRTKDFEYVLEETGFAKREDVDVDEFVEVRAISHFHGRAGTDGFFFKICAELKDVSFVPVSRAVSKKLRLAIPVEKSGGGVWAKHAVDAGRKMETQKAKEGRGMGAGRSINIFSGFEEHRDGVRWIAWLHTYSHLPPLFPSLFINLRSFSHF